MVDFVHLDLVTPDQRVLSEGVEMVVLPGELGDFGVMAYHAPFVSSLRAGVIEVHFTENKRLKYFITGGYANVTNNTCTVLAESLIPVEKLEKQVIQEDIARLRESIQKADSDIKRAELERQMLEAETKLILTA
jgi:F-type H+-transporting ATPase subunit epsilon